MKLSVIITIYNKERFLRSLFHSILKQGMKDDDYEIILVNDGSSDDSGLVCKEFISHHQTLKIKYREQRNQGVSIARNTGIEMAEGDYIHFLDCDDYMLDNSYTYILNHWGDKGYDYIGFGFIMLDLRNKDKVDLESQLVSGNEIEHISGHRLIAETRWPSSSISGLYRTAFLKNNGICFPDGVIVGEDVWFNSDFFFKSPSCVLTSCRPYVYRFHSGSTMTSISTDKAEKWFASYCSILSHLIGYKQITPPQENCGVKAENLARGIDKVIRHHLSVFMPKALQFRLPSERFAYWSDKFVRAGIIPINSKGGLSLRLANFVFQHPQTYSFLSWCCVNIFYRFIYKYLHK